MVKARAAKGKKNEAVKKTKAAVKTKSRKSTNKKETNGVLKGASAITESEVQKNEDSVSMIINIEHW